MSEELDPITGLPGDPPEKVTKLTLSKDQIKSLANKANRYSSRGLSATQVGGPDVIKDIRQKYSDIETKPGKVHLQNIDKLYKGLEYAGLKHKAKLAEEQGFWGELGGAVAQTAAEIVGGTLEGVGYLGDLTHWGDIISGGDGDWENWLSSAGSSLKEYVAEAAPIHENPLNPSTREWFLSGVPTVASFVGMMIPAVGTVSGLSKIGALGKAARISSKTSDLATLLKAGKSIEIAKTISVGGNRVKGLSTAIVSRHIENMMEANGVWQEQKQKLIFSGVDYMTAEKEASEAAMQVYNQNWVMLAQDLPQYMMLGRGMNAARGVKSIRQAAKMGDDVTKSAFKKTLGVVGIGASEGAEEAYQYVVSQDAMYMSDYANGLVAEKGFSERLGEYIKEEEFFDSVFFGALGGVAMNTMGKPITRAGDGIANMARHITGRESKDGLWGGFKKDWKEDPRVQEQIHRAAKISFLSKQLAEAAEKDVKLAYDNLRNQGVADMVMEAAAVGNYDRMVNEIKELQNMTPEQLEESQVTEEFLNEIPSILKEAEEIKDMWNAETKSTLPKYVGTMVSAKYKLKKLKDQQGGLQDELMKANEDFNFGELLTEAGQDYLKNEYIIQSLKRSIEQAEFILKNKPHMSEWEKTQLKEQIGIKDEKTGEWASGSWNEELENAKQFRVDSKASTKKEFKNSIELSNKDKELIKRIITTPSLDVVKAQTRLNWNTANINSHLNSLVRLGQTEYQTQIEDFQKAQVKTNEKIGKIRQLYNDVNSGQEATLEPQLGEDGKYYEHVRPLNHFNNQSKIREAEEILETLDEAEKKRFAPVIEEMKSIVDDNRSVYQKRARQKNNKAKRIKGLKGYHRVNRLAKKLNAFRENNDPRFRELTPSELFISDQDVFRVTYKGKDGVLSQEEGEMTFTPNDGGIPHIISGRTSKQTLEQLGIGMISEYAYPLEFSVEGDSLGIWIGDNLMSFSTLNPLSSIKWDKNENLASITLNDSKGNPVVITNPQLVAELSEFVYLYQELVDEFSKEEENVFLPEHGVTVQYNTSNPNKSKLYKTDENGQLYEVLGELPLQENGKYTIKGVILNKFLDNFKIGVLTPMSKNKIIKDRDYANNTAKAKQQTQEQAASQEAGFNEPTGQTEVSEAKKRGEEVETEVADDIEETEEVGAVALSESGDNVEVEGEKGKITVNSSDTIGGNFDNLSPEEQAELEAAGFGQGPNEEQGRNEEQEQYENENEEESPFKEDVDETSTEDEQQTTEDVETIISEEAWEEFVDEDYVSQEILEGIAKKMRDGIPFTEKELAVYQSKAGEIESINIIHSTKETENPQSGFFTVKLATGLIVKSPSHKLLINDNGEIEQRKSKLKDGSLEDQPYVFNFDMLNNPNVKEGHEVKFVHTPTKYSEEQDVEPGEEFINAPIYVFYKDGKNWAPVGLLQAGNTKERKLIFDALKTKDEVKATIKNQKVKQEMYSSNASNFRNRIDHNTGEKVFQSAHDSLSTAWVETRDGFELTNEAPIIILSTEGTSKATDTSSEPRFYDRDLDPKIASDVSRSEIKKMKGDQEGHIWAAVINPSGIYVPFKLSTSNLTQEAKDKVEELILMGDYDAINEITHSNYDSDLSREYDKFFQVINTGKSKFIRFKHKGIIYKIDHAQINKGLKGEKMTMFLQALDLKGKSLQSIKDKKGKTIKKEVTLEEFKGMISELLNKKKFNVINSNLRTGENYVSPISGKEYNSYEDYLTGAKDIDGNENAESPAEGPNDANSILQSDLWGHNGSFFFDQGVDYEIDEVSKKKPATKKTVKASTPQPTQTTEVKEGVSEVFKDNKELSNIGTEQQYSNYLDTIFPDSQTNEIFHHWSMKNIPIGEKIGEDILGRVQGIWLSKNKEHWKDIVGNKAKRLKQELKENYIIVNAKNIFVSSTVTSPDGKSFPKGYDAIFAYDEAPNNYEGPLKSEFKTIDDFEAVIKSKEQLHELGSKEDVQGFREFVSKSTQTSEVDLGTETAPKGGKVDIDIVKGKSPQPGAVVAFRTEGKTEQNMIDALEDNAVGNPFGPYAAIKEKTVVSVTRFLDWLEGKGDTNVMQDYRDALLAKVPELKGKTIYYYKDLGRPSHATALDYFLNKATTQPQTSEVEIPKVNIGKPTIDVNIGPDTGIFAIKQGNKVIGDISVSFEGNFKEGIIPKGTGEAFIAGVEIYEDSNKGERFGVSAYVEVANYMANLGYTLSSGISTSESAKRVWESLVKRGLAIKSGNSFLYKPTQQTSEVEVLSISQPTQSEENWIMEVQQEDGRILKVQTMSMRDRTSDRKIEDVTIAIVDKNTDIELNESEIKKDLPRGGKEKFRLLKERRDAQASAILGEALTASFKGVMLVNVSERTAYLNAIRNEFKPISKVEGNITQDNKSYYRGQIEKPTIDKDGNLVLYGIEDDLYKRAGLKSKGVSMTDNLETAVGYGEGQLEGAEARFDDEWGYDINTWEAEDAYNELKDNGYWLIQIPKNISNEIIKEAGEVKVIGNKIIIPKGQFKIEQISEVETKKEVKKEKSEPLFSEELTPPKTRKVKAVKKHKGTAQEVTTAKINDIVKESDNFELATVELEDEYGDIIDESVYLDTETNELIERQSNAVVRYINGDPIDSSKPDVIAGAAVGNLVDILGREIFAGNKINFEAIQKEANKANEESGYNIKVGEDVVTKLKLILSNVYDELIASGHTIVSKDVFITAQYNNKEAQLSGLSGIGGTLDLIAIDKNGIAHIIDFKNIKLTEKNKNRIFENIFGGGRYTSKVEYWSNQQTAYKIITEKYGVPVGSINILGVSTEYEYDETDSEIELKNVTLTTELVKTPNKYISPLSNGLIQLEESDIIKKELPPRIGNEVFTGKSATSDPTESFDLDVEDDSNDAEAEAFLKNKCK